MKKPGLFGLFLNVMILITGAFLLSLPPGLSLSAVLQDDKEYVGFATLPNQVHRKSVKKGFDFTLMVAGMGGRCVCVCMGEGGLFLSFGALECCKLHLLHYTLRTISWKISCS